VGKACPELVEGRSVPTRLVAFAKAISSRDSFVSVWYQLERLSQSRDLFDKQAALSIRQYSASPAWVTVHVGTLRPSTSSGQALPTLRSLSTDAQLPWKNPKTERASR